MRPRLYAAIAATFCVCVAGYARAAAAAPAKPQTVPLATLPMERFGYRPNPNGMALRGGYASATVHFIDPSHVLLTFSARKLMARSPEQREGDDDHTVRALVIHVPDGKVVRETEWRMHDRAPYLWALGHGHFILRERSDLYSLDPLGRSEPEQLGRHLLLRPDGEIRSLQISPQRDLLLLETAPAAQVGDDPDEKKEPMISANFYRVESQADGPVRLVSRGKARAREAFGLAFTSSGVLQTVKEDRMHWGFDFYAYSGKKIELAGFTSTCRPRSIFISDAEFFAYGCRGGEDRRLMGGFNLLAQAKWVFTLDDSPLWLAVVAAPEVGRFAVRNTLTTQPAQDADRLGKEDVRAQEVRVYSTREGEELLRVVCSPEQRPDGNFALSPDGLTLVTLHGAQMEIYKLPPVSAADRALHEREETALEPLKSSEDLNVALALSKSEQKK